MWDVASEYSKQLPQQTTHTPSSSIQTCMFELTDGTKAVLNANNLHNNDVKNFRGFPAGARYRLGACPNLVLSADMH